MTPFQIKSLTDVDILLIYNSLRETIEAFDDEGQFHARISAELDYAKTLMGNLQKEIDTRTYLLD